MKKYKVTQEFMEALNKWKEDFKNSDGIVSISDMTLERIPKIVDDWHFGGINWRDKNERFGAIINWINGEDVFEGGTPKYVVQRKDAVLNGVHQYLNIGQSGNIHLIYGLENATHFDGFEKASEWANKHLEVVKVDE